MTGKKKDKVATAGDTMRNVQHIYFQIVIYYSRGGIVRFISLFVHLFYLFNQVDKMIGASIKSCGQSNLAHDGTRDWDDGLRSWLDKEYPDWKDLHRTYMVPPSFESKGNEAKGKSAEEKMYDKLQELGLKNNEPMFVVHSFGYSEHVPGNGRKRSWVMGETDFVVIHRNHGPIFFQVKATETGDKYKEAEEQLRKDKIAFLRYCQKLEEGMVKEKISVRKITEVFKNVPGYVALPNCKRAESINIPDNTLFQEDFRSAEAFSIWWNQNIGRSAHPPLTQAIYEHLVMWYVSLYMH